MLIAIASTDGEKVDEHFGRANRFFIYDILQENKTLITVREVEPLSTGDKQHSFDPQRMAAVIDAVKDCARIYCAKIGDRPKQELEKIGVSTVIETGPISSIVGE